MKDLQKILGFNPTQEFISPSENNFNTLIKKINFINKVINSGVKKGARRKLLNKFKYDEHLSNLEYPEKGVSFKKICMEINSALAGGIRSHDPLMLINMIPSPTLDSIAAATFLEVYNSNIGWDLFSGKLILYEKKIFRILGSLVEWKYADGISCAGGKITLLYAIKSGLTRCNSQTRTSGINHKRYVVLASEGAHYSVEHVCVFLGIGSDNCIRIPCDENWRVKTDLLEKKLNQLIKSGAMIATIIACAGTTTNYATDPIDKIKLIIDKMVVKHKLNYRPYLHVDSVIGWVWLTFLSPYEFIYKNHSKDIIKKIKIKISQIKHISHADSFSADFHKDGLCPYSSSILITKNTQTLSNLTIPNYKIKPDPTFGDINAHRYTIENSRPALGILAIWIIIKKFGIQGMRNYLLYLLSVSKIFRKILAKNQIDFEVINSFLYSGWEIIFIIKFKGFPSSWKKLQNSNPEIRERYNKLCEKFIAEIWDRTLKNDDAPLFGVIPLHRQKPTDHHLAAFLFHPISLYYTENNIKKIISYIKKAKREFDKNINLHQDKQGEMHEPPMK